MPLPPLQICNLRRFDALRQTNYRFLSLTQTGYMRFVRAKKDRLGFLIIELPKKELQMSAKEEGRVIWKGWLTRSDEVFSSFTRPSILTPITIDVRR